MLDYNVERSEGASVEVAAGNAAVTTGSAWGSAEVFEGTCAAAVNVALPAQAGCALGAGFIGVGGGWFAGKVYNSVVG